ncbi:hypothetical protein ACQKND_10035 [Viridibacillus arvi]|uniref:hypothetical protein n=1 Tax=Viridibacillus arvi TaxID=263475 RepID=UPI003CFF0A86
MKRQLVHRILIATGNFSIGQLALYQKYGFRRIEIEIEHDYLIKHYKEEIFENGIHVEIG